VADVQTMADEFPTASDLARRLGFRTLLSAPLMREGAAIGTIMVRRTEARLFTERQMALLQTFADQAVIAIENVRLFTELERRNRDLAEALEQQTATSDILQVISSSPTEIQPVFDAIIHRAATLCGASFGGLHLFDGERITLDAHSDVPAEELAVLLTRVFPYTPKSNSLMGRAILERRPVQIEDVRSTPGYHSPALQTLAREELAIDPEELGGSAWVAAGTSFLLFAVGAVIPVLPFIILSGETAVMASIGFSAIALFALGAAITLLTGRPVVTSGARQLGFGLGAAGLTYVVGRLIGASVMP